MTPEVSKKAKALVDSVSEDVNGKPGMPFSGNGGLVSDRTIRACDDLRIAMAKSLADNDNAWAEKFLEDMAQWWERASATSNEDVAIQAAAQNALNCRRIASMLTGKPIASSPGTQRPFAPTSEVDEVKRMQERLQMPESE